MRLKVYGIFVSILFLACGCDIDCVYPGEGVSTTVHKIDVPVKINGIDESKPETLWVDSGITVTERDEVSIFVSGQINFCDIIKKYDDADEQIKEEYCPEKTCKSSVLVPNVFCSGGVLPNMNVNKNDLKDIRNNDDICKGNGERDSAGYYVDSGLTVSPGDSLIFSLVPYIDKRINDCSTDLKSDDFTNYSNSDFEYENGKYIKDKNGETLDPKKICESGQTILIHGKEYPLGPFKGRNQYTEYVANGYTPHSNKVFVGNIKYYRNWFNGSLIDLRIIIPKDIYNNKAFCSYKESTEDVINTKYPRMEYSLLYECYKEDPSTELNRFSAYAINYMCNTLDVKNKKLKAGVYSIRYDEDVGDATCIDNNPCSCYRGGKIVEGMPPRSFADLLVAKIGNNSASGNSESDLGEQCIYDGADTKPHQCMQILYNNKIRSMELNKFHKVNDNIKNGSTVWLGIAGPTMDDRSEVLFSGYKVKVQRYCTHDNGKLLYVYIGNEPNTKKPGDSGTYSLEMGNNTNLWTNSNEDSNPDAPGKNKNTRYDNTHFWINPNEDSSPGAPEKYKNARGSGKIYFGIKGAATSDTAKSDSSYKQSQNNKYIVTLVKPETASFLSDFFMSVYNQIIELFYGRVNMTDASGVKTGIIKNLYENIAKGLLPAVQATLVLYIVLYGMMFLFGIVQNTSYDVLIRVIKISFIAVLVSSYSWSFFGDVLFNLFVKSANQWIYYFSGENQGNFNGNNTFTFVDKTVGVLLTNAFWLRMLSLLFAGPVGWLIMAMILWGVWLFFSAIVEAMITYLMIIIAVGFFLSLAPLFIVFILFKHTKTLFEGWLKMLISFALRPIFIFATLAFLNYILLSLFYTITQFGACNTCIITIGIFGDPLCILQMYLPIGFSNNYSMNERMEQSYNQEVLGFYGLPLSIAAVISFLIIAQVMKVVVKITDGMVNSITGTITTDLVGGAGYSASQGLLSLVGTDDQTQQQINNAISSTAKAKRSVKIEAAEQKDKKEDRKADQSSMLKDKNIPKINDLPNNKYQDASKISDNRSISQAEPLAGSTRSDAEVQQNHGIEMPASDSSINVETENEVRQNRNILSDHIRIEPTREIGDGTVETNNNNGIPQIGNPKEQQGQEVGMQADSRANVEGNGGAINNTIPNSEAQEISSQKEKVAIPTTSNNKSNADTNPKNNGDGK